MIIGCPRCVSKTYSPLLMFVCKKYLVFLKKEKDMKPSILVVLSIIIIKSILAVGLPNIIRDVNMESKLLNENFMFFLF